MNMSRKAANTSIYQQSPSPYIPLQPLVSLITGLDIVDFPGSIRDMVQLSGECFFFHFFFLFVCATI
jgi:hypothetical protein